MCKYCKRLKELRDLDAKQYEKTIRAWQRRDLTARNLVTWMYCMLGPDEKLVFRSRVNEFINCDYVGK